jgi:hypothetical protein
VTQNDLPFDTGTAAALGRYGPSHRHCRLTLVLRRAAMRGGRGRLAAGGSLAVAGRDACNGQGRRRKMLLQRLAGGHGPVGWRARGGGTEAADTSGSRSCHVPLRKGSGAGMAERMEGWGRHIVAAEWRRRRKGRKAHRSRRRMQPRRQRTIPEAVIGDEPAGIPGRGVLVSATTFGARRTIRWSRSGIQLLWPECTLRPRPGAPAAACEARIRGTLLEAAGRAQPAPWHDWRCARWCHASCVALAGAAVARELPSAGSRVEERTVPAARIARSGGDAADGPVHGRPTGPGGWRSGRWPSRIRILQRQAATLSSPTAPVLAPGRSRP